MLHHLWCAATLAKGVCPTSELRRALNTASLTVVATRSAWPATEHQQQLLASGRE